MTETKPAETEKDSETYKRILAGAYENKAKREAQPRRRRPLKRDPVKAK